MASDIVELVVFTNDDAFLLTLREAIGGARRLWHVPSADQVSDMLLAGQVGILVLDTQSQLDSAGAFVSQIKRQFPDLVVVVAGNRDAESSLAKLISDGSVYRFIHKPMSPARAKLFVEAAVKKYDEQRRNVPPLELRAPRTAAWRPQQLIGAGLTAALLIALGLFWALRHRGDAGGSAQPPLAANPTAATSVEDLGPPAVAEVRERLLAQAEKALLEERVEEAATAIESARRAGVEASRLSFLSAQLAKLRSQKASAQARAKAEARAAPAGVDGDEELRRLLNLAAERLKEGRLIEPAQDSARFYVLQALRVDPRGNAAQAAQQTLAHALLAEAHAAIDRRDFAHASALLESAAGIAAPTNIDNARSQLQAARARDEAETADQLVKSAAERLQQDRLLEPAADSAKHFITAARALAPKDPGLTAVVQDFGTRAVAHARRAMELKQYDAARGWLAEAAAVGYSAPDATAAQNELTESAARQQFLANPIDASQLSLVKSVKPVYPRAAAVAGTEGWVELDFTVGESGAVQDIVVHAADPAGVFDSAAIGALSRWRYQPVVQDAKAVPQRARIRIRFTLER